MPPKRQIRQSEIVRVFAERLRETRVSYGMTQAELAAKAHVTTSYIWRLEAAASAPGIDLLERLAKALGVAPADLLINRRSQPIPILKEQLEKLFTSLIQSADQDLLLLLNPLLARLKRT